VRDIRPTRPSRRRSLRVLRLAAGAALLTGALGCGRVPPPPSSQPAPATATLPGWRLIWADEFDAPGLPDSSRWTYEEGLIRNREAQYYTRRPENARVENGMLVIEARKEAHRGSQYTSASLTTEGRASWRYGRIEVRARVPQGRGMWPAIWTLGTNRRQVGWPMTGEIDIMEFVGFDPDTIHANVHTAAFNHRDKTGRGAKKHVPRPFDRFHLYAMEWTKDRIDVSVDGETYFTFRNTGNGVREWPFDAEQYLILNVAVGGAWGGQRGIDDSIFPQRFLVDYVRVYQRPD
jgi:beta-glucanase (GH16 family)